MNQIIYDNKYNYKFDSEVIDAIKYVIDNRTDKCKVKQLELKCCKFCSKKDETEECIDSVEIENKFDEEGHPLCSWKKCMGEIGECECVISKKYAELTILAAIRLDNDLFFKGGGGQFPDKGFIELEKGQRLPIVGFDDINGYGYIIVDAGKDVCFLKKGVKVKGIINREHRVDAMQQHLAQHILSGSCFKAFKVNTKAFHMGRFSSQLDFDAELTNEQVKELEILANKAIDEKIAVENFSVKRDELEKYRTRRPVKTKDEDIRILKIGELDQTACCGMHPDNTAEVRMILIERAYRNDKTTRIEFIAGNRAVKKSIENKKLLKKLCNGFSCSEENILAAIENIKTELENEKERIKSLEHISIEAIVSSLDFELMIKNSPNNIIFLDLGKFDMDLSKRVISASAEKLSKISSDYAVFGLIDEDKVMINNKLQDGEKVKALLEFLRKEYDFKGGGKENISGKLFRKTSGENLKNDILKIDKKK